ncbi:MAG TPA: phosphoribosylformylglycinamidine cyclo-ligase [Candidatus Thermoplasmatota archaeon]|nr:phosphoribosylformylglycinamidine cyclo-ligase [Candidatus Thermoplasmatota archaeon]
MAKARLKRRRSSPSREASKASKSKARGAKPGRKPAKAKRAAGKAAKRASPAPKGVQVKRPAVLKLGERALKAGADAPAFEVRLDASQMAQTSSPMAVAAKAATTMNVGRPPSVDPGAGMTYAGSGVDIHREDKAIEALAGMVNFQRQGFGAPLGRIGHFAGLVDFGPEHALVLCTDGVGSKVEIANAIRKWDTVGIDCVAMNVNDCICVGAEPLAFVDYLAVQDPDPALTKQIGVGLNEGCRQANCSLIGGETASLPGIIKGFDLAGTCMGFGRKADLVDGSKIKPGDLLIGLASTGIHSNGYSLARRAFESAGHKYTDPWPWAEDKAYAGKSIGELLLEPTRIYVREVMALLKSGIPVHGLSHITGSGLRKLRRINQGVKYDVSEPLPVHPVFKRVQQLGKVADAEMYKTFNMGMGFVVVVPAKDADRAVKQLRSLVNYQVKIVGKVAKGSGVHHPVGGMH